MNIQLNLDKFIPSMNRIDKIYELFSLLGYKIIESKLESSPSVYQLPSKVSALIEKVYAVANYNRRFQIILFKIKDKNNEIIRSVCEKILKEIDYPFLIFTTNFNDYIFTFVEKIRESPGVFKRKLIKLTLDIKNPYHTDKEIINSLKIDKNITDPAKIYQIFKNAFSVEKVTNKFFKEYREVFETVNQALVDQNPHLKSNLFSKKGFTENFSKKLLGRLMFLYFIQKKGWLNCQNGWGSGDKKFLYNKFQEAKKLGKNYFKDYLEPLFFETLNNPIRERPDHSTIFGGKIPFLNGGLFEPDYDYKSLEYQINLSNEIFEDIFSVFEKYNFTVKEDEPLEKEVAVDPEMLGKVFENLLEENLRKGKGTYYTPREIVHYMCHQSLAYYLSSETAIEFDEIKNFLDRPFNSQKEGLSEVIKKNAVNIFELLKKIKIVDPACGSGAFLVGMLHEILNAKKSLLPFVAERKSDYEIKKEIIENNLYGVDIDEGAVEIAKLRLWLSLVVDHNLSEIEPLPNLDYKIMVGNSLIDDLFINGKTIKLFNYQLLREENGEKMKNLFEKDEKIGLFEKVHLQNIKPIVEKIKEKKIELFKAYDLQEKNKLRKEINDLENKLIIESLKEELNHIKSRISSLKNKSNLRSSEENKELTNLEMVKSDIEGFIRDEKKLDKYKSKNLFLWHLRFIEVFDEKDGFDIVIANPPYIQLQKAFDDQRKYADLYKHENYQTFDRTGDIYCLFYEKGIELLKPCGFLTYITSNKWMRASYGEKLRAFFSQYQPVELIDLGPDVFETATVDTNIIIIKKTKNNSDQFKAVTLKKDEKNNLSNVFENKDSYIKISPSAWFVGYNLEYRLKEKIEKIGKPLKDWDVKIYYGIKTGLNEAFIITTEKRDEILRNCKTEEERKRTEKIIKPILRGRDIKRYSYEWAGLWVIGTFPALNLNIEDYPALKKYFLDNFDIRQLEQSGKKYPHLGFNARKKTGNKWFETQDQIAYYKEFEKEKIVWNRITDKIIFSLLPSGFYILDSTFMFTGNNLRYLLALLNSKLCDWWIKISTATLGEGSYGAKIYIKNVPLISINEDNKKIIKEIEFFINKILFFENKDLNLIMKYQNQINQLVYKLYDLTPEEIKIVEKNG
mgnify:CR=1 FL=1